MERAHSVREETGQARERALVALGMVAAGVSQQVRKPDDWTSSENGTVFSSSSVFFRFFSFFFFFFSFLLASS